MCKKENCGMNHKQKCCCGLPKRVGTCVLLWWTMVWCVTGFYVVNYQFERLHRIVNQCDWLFENSFYRSFIINLLIIIKVVCIVGLYGVYTKNFRLLMPYIIYRTVFDILIVIGLFPLMLDMYLNPRKYAILELINGRSFIAKMAEDAQDSFDHVFILFILIEFLFMAVEVHFIKVILSCYDLMESSSKMCKKEILTLANMRGSSPNGKFYFTSDSEISTAV